MLFDKLHTRFVEYFIFMDLMVNLAIKRLINNIDLIRNLRTGKSKPPVERVVRTGPYKGLYLIACPLLGAVFWPADS